MMLVPKFLITITADTLPTAWVMLKTTKASTRDKNSTTRTKSKPTSLCLHRFSSSIPSNARRRPAKGRVELERFAFGIYFCCERKGTTSNQNEVLLWRERRQPTNTRTVENQPTRRLLSLSLHSRSSFDSFFFS